MDYFGDYTWKLKMMICGMLLVNMENVECCCLLLLNWCRIDFLFWILNVVV